jgi:hypothetical protein
VKFSEATSVARDGATWHGVIREGWDVGGNANGGYLMALAARAMAGHSRPHPVALNAHFLSPGRPGPVTLVPTVAKTGRRFTTVRATLASAERPLVELLGSFADLEEVEGPVRIDATPPDLPPPDACVPLGPATGSPGLMSRFDLRLHPDDVGFARGAPSGRPLFRGWLRFVDEPVDVFGLILAADAFPPTIFNANLPIGWAPTVEMTVHARGLPQPGWLRCRFSTRFITGGMLEEDGEIWDESDRLVAQSRQIALLPRVEPA